MRIGIPLGLITQLKSRILANFNLGKEILWELELPRDLLYQLKNEILGNFDLRKEIPWELEFP